MQEVFLYCVVSLEKKSDDKKKSININKRIITSRLNSLNIKQSGTKTCDGGNPCPGLGQEHKCGGVNPVAHANKSLNLEF